MGLVRWNIERKNIFQQKPKPTHSSVSSWDWNDPQIPVVVFFAMGYKSCSIFFLAVKYYPSIGEYFRLWNETLIKQISPILMGLK